MSLLLDTSVLLWWLIGGTRLSQAALDAIGDPANRVFVSAASAWEVAIKMSLGKLRAPANVAEWLPDEMRKNRFTPLAVTFEHAVAVEHLPRHHRDPFDRLLIAQALAEGGTIVTPDRQFERYGVPVIHASQH